MAQVALGSDPLADRIQSREDVRRERAEKLRHFLEHHYYLWAQSAMKRPEKARAILEREFGIFMETPEPDRQDERLEMAARKVGSRQYSYHDKSGQDSAHERAQ